MPPRGDSTERNGQSQRYVIPDPKTGGAYEVVTRTSKTQEELDAIITSVIEDEGRVAAGRRRTVYV